MSLLGFVAIIVTEHLLDPSLDPLRHQVSEYANSDSGPLTTIGFLLWALSLLATGLLVRPPQGERRLVVLLLLAAAGVLLVAVFPTETSAGELPPGATLTAGGRLHDLGSGLTTLALLAAVAVAALSPRWDRAFRHRSAALAAAAIATSLALLLVGPEVGGLRQRLVLLAGCCWQLLLLAELRQPAGRVRAGTVR